MGLLRWGILGCGKISSDFVASLSGEPGQHAVVAVAARDKERAEAFIEERRLGSGCAAYGNYKELACDGEVEAAYVGTVTSAHLHVVKMLLEAGKRVIINWSFIMTKQENRCFARKPWG